ncbi:hypothetical protein [Pseudonocardia sp.]|uniref:hypothetical protein n=1 Tax=Pseudonocardia sp. TaxID=60912 RepID=UPI00263A2677|nr:hypothetical protein [Pseudonocardia sp.]
MRESRETDEVLVCMAQRLQGQLERQLTLVERLQDHGRDETVADLAELRTSLQRTLRGSENLLVLGGAQQGPRVRGPRSVADVLADARAGVEDPGRVGLGPAPGAAFAPRAVAGLLALVTELLTYGLTASSALGRVEVTSRRAEDGGVVVEVACDGSSPLAGEIDELNQRLGDRPIIDDIVGNRVGLFVAARLARRCGAALRVQHPRGGAIATTGLTVSVHCPPDLLDAAGVSASDTARPWTRDPAPTGNAHGGVGRGPEHGGGPAYSGTGHVDTGHTTTGYGNSGYPNSGYGSGARYGGSGPVGNGLSEYAAGGNGPGGNGPGGKDRGANGHGSNALGGNAPGGNGQGNNGPSHGNGNGNGRVDHLPPDRPEPTRRPDPLLDPLPSRPVPPRDTGPVATPPAARPSLWDDEPVRPPHDDPPAGADELFGPLTSSLRDRMRDAGPTPIYESVASAWFVDPDTEQADGRRDTPDGAPADWSTPSDAEWRAASERASRPEPVQASTAAGLPRRRPGTQMVAPPRHGSAAPLGGSTDREPERVRERLAVYQQGLERGRHRADPDR